MSIDIDNDSQTLEFDCDKQAVVEGIILQQADNEFLPDKAGHNNDMKVASSYFHVTSDTDFSGASGPRGFGAFQNGLFHGYIMSSATANVIEATSDPSNGDYAYIQSQEGLTFEDFVDGKIFVEHGGQGYVYGGHLSPGEAVSARHEEQQSGAQPLPNPSVITPPEKLNSEYQKLLASLDEYEGDPSSANLDQLQQDLGQLAAGWDIQSKMSLYAPQESAKLLDTFNKQMTALMPRLEQIDYGIDTLAETYRNNLIETQTRFADTAGIDINALPSLDNPAINTATIASAPITPANAVLDDVSAMTVAPDMTAPVLGSDDMTTSLPTIEDLTINTSPPSVLSDLDTTAMTPPIVVLENIGAMDVAAADIKERYNAKTDIVAEDPEHDPSGGLSVQPPPLNQHFVDTTLEVATNSTRLEVSLDVLREQDWQPHGDGLKIIDQDNLEQISEALAQAGISARVRENTIGNTTIKSLTIGESAAQKLNDLLEADDPQVLISNRLEASQTFIKDQNWQPDDGGMKLVSSQPLDDVIAALEEAGIAAKAQSVTIAGTEINSIEIPETEIEDLQKIIGLEGLEQEQKLDAGLLGLGR